MGGERLPEGINLDLGNNWTESGVTSHRTGIGKKHLHGFEKENTHNAVSDAETHYERAEAEGNVEQYRALG